MDKTGRDLEKLAKSLEALPNSAPSVTGLRRPGIEAPRAAVNGEPRASAFILIIGELRETEEPGPVEIEAPLEAALVGPRGAA